MSEPALPVTDKAAETGGIKDGSGGAPQSRRRVHAAAAIAVACLVAILIVSIAVPVSNNNNKKKSSVALDKGSIGGGLEVSSSPTIKPVPSATPSASPTASPSQGPTTSASPSGVPSTHPSSAPSGKPSSAPSSAPTGSPTSMPSAFPTSISDKICDPPEPPSYTLTDANVMLWANENVFGGEYVASEEFGVQLKQELDGNLVLCCGTDGECQGKLWETGYHGPESDRYISSMQGDGNFVTRHRDTNQVVWTAFHAGGGGNYFAAYDANQKRLVVYKGSVANPEVHWATYSYHQTHPPTPPLPPNAAPSVSPAPAASNLLILAHYYSWYIRGDWSRHGYPTEPLLGKYGTDSPVTSEIHNEWAERAGVDAWVLSWAGVDEMVEEHFSWGMLNARNIDKMKFMMMYAVDSVDTADFNDPYQLEKLIYNMKAIKDTYFHHPSYLYVNDRPVVGIYLTRKWVNFQSEMLDTVKEALGYDVLFIADEPYFSGQRRTDTARNGVRDGKPVFETYMTYNMYTDQFINDGDTAEEFMMREALPIYEHWSNETVFFPNVIPAYEDFRPQNPHLPGDIPGWRAQLETFSCLPRPSWYKEGTYPDMLFVTSWNEWWEGTQIEPDLANEYGFSWIDELADFKKQGPKCKQVNN
mmetsp:Transcript_4387/g.6257  ORF Transcript_4387/g.6257 Transcript_4387/m.6257 type:complete len:642 (+) Transcript_4387:97-2022(+)